MAHHSEEEAPMSTPVIVGFPQSSYVWTARAALDFKGVAYDFEPIAPPANRAPAHLARHPWGKVPAFQHGDVHLYETNAICEYVDGTFDGPSLMPEKVVDRARARQVISIADCYLYPAAVVDYALQYVFPRGANGQPDRATIDGSLPRIEKALGVLDGLLGDGPWFAGDLPGQADFHVGPLVGVLMGFPEGQQLVGKTAHLGRHLGRVMGIEAFGKNAPSKG